MLTLISFSKLSEITSLSQILMIQNQVMNVVAVRMKIRILKREVPSNRLRNTLIIKLQKGEGKRFFLSASIALLAFKDVVIMVVVVD